MAKKPSRKDEARLRKLIEEATVDCYNEFEEHQGMVNMIEENVVCPFRAKVIGNVVEDRLPAIAPVEDVVAVATLGGACGGRHPEIIQPGLRQGKKNLGCPGFPGFPVSTGFPRIEDDQAAADHQRRLELEDPIALNDQAWKLLTGPEGRRDPVRALDLSKRAVTRQPNDAALLNTLGVAQYRNGLYQDAVVTLEKSLALGKGSHDAGDLFFLAMCHAKLGQPKQAKDCYEQALKWRREHPGLPDREQHELKALQVEAENALRD